MRIRFALPYSPGMGNTKSTLSSPGEKELVSHSNPRHTGENLRRPQLQAALLPDERDHMAHNHHNNQQPQPREQGEFEMGEQEQENQDLIDDFMIFSASGYPPLTPVFVGRSSPTINQSVAHSKRSSVCGTRGSDYQSHSPERQCGTNQGSKRSQRHRDSSKTIQPQLRSLSQKLHIHPHHTLDSTVMPLHSLEPRQSLAVRADSKRPLVDTVDISLPAEVSQGIVQTQVLQDGRQVALVRPMVQENHQVDQIDKLSAREQTVHKIRLQPASSDISSMCSTNAGLTLSPHGPSPDLKADMSPGDGHDTEIFTPLSLNSNTSSDLKLHVQCQAYAGQHGVFDSFSSSTNTSITELFLCTPASSKVEFHLERRRESNNSPDVCAMTRGPLHCSVLPGDCRSVSSQPNESMYFGDTHGCMEEALQPMSVKDCSMNTSTTRSRRNNASVRDRSQMTDVHMSVKDFDRNFINSHGSESEMECNFASVIDNSSTRKPSDSSQVLRDCTHVHISSDESDEESKVKWSSCDERTNDAALKGQTGCPCPDSVDTTSIRKFAHQEPHSALSSPGSPMFGGLCTVGSWNITNSQVLALGKTRECSTEEFNVNNSPETSDFLSWNMEQHDRHAEPHAFYHDMQIQSQTFKHCGQGLHSCQHSATHSESNQHLTPSSDGCRSNCCSPRSITSCQISGTAYENNMETPVHGRRVHFEDQIERDEDDKESGRIVPFEEPENDMLSVFDRPGENVYYAAYLCVAGEDLEHFGLPFHRTLEKWGFRIFLPPRDLVLTGPKYENMARGLEERCNGKIIVVLSRNYLDSAECLFMTYFARTLDPDSRLRNIIPVQIDHMDSPPHVLKGVAVIRYNHDYKAGWLRTKLIEAIAA